MECSYEGYDRTKGSLDSLLENVSDIGFYGIITVVAIGGVAFVVLVCIALMRTCTQMKGGCMIPIITSWGGLVYLLLIVTVPVFGWPTSWEQDVSFPAPKSPHFSPRSSRVEMKEAFLGWLINGVALLVVPWLTMATCLIFTGMIVITPILMIAFLLLSFLCRMADVAADLIVEHEDDIADGNADMSVKQAQKGEANHEGAPNAPVPTSCCTPANLCTFGLMAFSCIWPAFLVTLKWWIDLYIAVSIWSVTFDLNLDFDLSFGIAIPCFRFPTWSFACQFTHTMQSIFISAGCMAMFSLIVGSDILTMIFDRLSRAEQLGLKLWKKEDRENGAFAAAALASCVSLTKEIVWKVVELLVAIGSENVLAAGRTMMNDTPEGVDVCSFGLTIFAKTLAAYFFVVFSVSLFRMGTGSIHHNCLFVLARPLVENEMGCSCEQLKRTFALSRITLGTMLFPFLPVVVAASEAEDIIFDGNDVKEPEQIKEAFSAENLKEIIGEHDEQSCIDRTFDPLSLRFLTAFGCDGMIWCSVRQLYKKFHEEEEKKDHPLQMHGASIRDNFLLSVKISDEEEIGKCSRLASMIGVMFGFWPQSFLMSHWALARSQMWQSQIEPVQKASGNYYGLALQAIPAVGVLLGKISIYANEHPTWIMTDCEMTTLRSFRDDISFPDKQLILLHLCSLVKVGLLIAAWASVTGASAEDQADQFMEADTGMVYQCANAVFVVALLEKGVMGMRLDAQEKPKDTFAKAKGQKNLKNAKMKEGKKRRKSKTGQGKKRADSDDTAA